MMFDKSWIGNYFFLFLFFFLLVLCSFLFYYFFFFFFFFFFSLSFSLSLCLLPGCSKTPHVDKKPAAPRAAPNPLAIRPYPFLPFALPQPLVPWEFWNLNVNLDDYYWQEMFSYLLEVEVEVWKEGSCLFLFLLLIIFVFDFFLKKRRDGEKKMGIKRWMNEGKRR